MILAAIAASFAAIATTFRFWWQKLKLFYNKHFSKQKKKDTDSEPPEN